MSILLLDTHVLHWWSAEPEKISKSAAEVLNDADEIAAAAISWFELAWLARNERITVAIPIRSWLERLSADVRTVGISPAIAETAVSLPSTFPGDPADRLIYATAVEYGWQLVTKDRKLRGHRHGRNIAVW